LSRDARSLRACGHFVGIALVATWSGGLPDARADEPGQAAPSHVVILRDRADKGLDRAGLRLSAELRAAGFEVEERESAAEDDPRQLMDQGDVATAGPFATVLLRRARAGAATDVWVADHVTHKTVVRRLAARGVGDAAARSLALRVVELMKASVVEGLVLPPSEDDGAGSGDAATPSPAPAPALPPADVASWAADGLRMPSTSHAPARIVLSLGAAAAYAGPDVGASFAPEFEVGWRASDRWSLDFFAAAPAVGARVEAREGNASVQQELALVEGALHALTSGPLRGFVSLGAGAYHLDATGYAAPPFYGGHAEAWAALASLGAGAWLHLAGSASLLVDARELIALPRPAIVFGAERVAEAMHPGTLVCVSLAAEL
jgi:hypothetical protein